MTLSASRVPGTREVLVRTTSGAVTNEVREDVGQVRNFWADLGRVIDEIDTDEQGG